MISCFCIENQEWNILLNVYCFLANCRCFITLSASLYSSTILVQIDLVIGNLNISRCIWMYSLVNFDDCTFRTDLLLNDKRVAFCLLLSFIYPTLTTHTLRWRIMIETCVTFRFIPKAIQWTRFHHLGCIQQLFDLPPYAKSPPSLFLLLA